ncbi:MAG: signal peptidase I [Robiginitomaculum sp.]
MAGKPNIDKARTSTSSGPKDKAFRSARAKWRDRFITLLWAVLLAFIVRSFLFQPLKVPSQSMQPNILAGDVIVASKYAYGYGEKSAAPLSLPIKDKRWLGRTPRRGDVMVFSLSGAETIYAKRIIGLPGDRVEMGGGQLTLNGAPAGLEPQSEIHSVSDAGNPDRVEIWRETLPNGVSYLIYDSQKNSPSDILQAMTVPPGHYFVLGDHRDASKDSRLPRDNGGMGFVSQGELLGRAEFILLSAQKEFYWARPSTWSKMRTDRIFKDIP